MSEAAENNPTGLHKVNGFSKRLEFSHVKQTSMAI